MVINQLPETFRQHSNDEVLVTHLGELPGADCRTIVAPGPDRLSLGLMLPRFDPEQSDEFFAIESSRGVNMLDIQLVVEYGTALWAWINTAQRTAPSDVSEAFRSVDWNAYIIFQKADEMVTFQGFLDNSGGRWGFRMGMRQPITYASDSLGEHQIYTEGYEDVMLRYQETYDYPLPLPKTPDGTITVASFVYTFLGIPID